MEVNNIKKSMKTFFVLIAFFLIFVTLSVLVPETTKADCSNGGTCYSQLTIDLFTCESSGLLCSEQISTPPTGDHDENCTDGGPGTGLCRTSRSVCSTSDSCGIIGWNDDGYGNLTAICGWNGSSCVADDCGSCGKWSCCGPGGPTATPGGPTPTPTPPPSCSGIIGPSNPTTSNLTGTSVTLNWVSGSGGTTQLLRLGPNRIEVETGCPGGVGPGLGCLVGTPLPLGADTYNTGNILTPNTTYYWRVAEYNGVNGDYKDFGNICKAASSVSFATPPSSCTLDAYVPSPVNVAAGDTANVTVNVTPINGTIDRVDFSIDDSSRATINPLSDAAVPYQTVVTGVTPGSTILHASVYMAGVLRCGGAAPIADVNVGNPGAWWQVVDADVITNGDVVSPIPGTCSLPLCNPVFAVQGPGNSPGVPLYAGNYDFNSGVGQGTVSDSPPWGWHANSNYSATTDYNYAFFYRLVPGDTVRNNIATPVIDPNTLKNLADVPANVSPDGYMWAFRTGDLTIRGESTLGARKIILFVDGNLTIGDGTGTGTIDLTTGQGFFMAIASGNITVYKDVNNPPGSEDLEGLYVANGDFITSSDGDDEQLNIRGMVAAYNTVSLGRNLADNTQKPSEIFTYAPDLLFNYPASLTLKRTRWKEITP